MGDERPPSEAFRSLTGETAGDTHRRFMREVRAAFAETGENSLETATIGLTRLQSQGLILDSELDPLRRMCQVVFEVAHGERDREEMCAVIGETHAQLQDTKGTSEVALAISGIAATLCISGGDTGEAVTLARSRSNTVDGAIVGGVIAGAVIGGAIGGIGGSIAGAVIGGIAGGAAAIGATKDDTD